MSVSPRLRQTHADIGVVVLTQFSNASYGSAALDSGAEGRAYLLRQYVGHRGALVDAITEVAHGGAGMRRQRSSTRSPPTSGGPTNHRSQA